VATDDPPAHPSTRSIVVIETVNRPRGGAPLPYSITRIAVAVMTRRSRRGHRQVGADSGRGLVGAAVQPTSGCCVRRVARPELELALTSQARSDGAVRTGWQKRAVHDQAVEVLDSGHVVWSVVDAVELEVSALTGNTSPVARNGNCHHAVEYGGGLGVRVCADGTGHTRVHDVCPSTANQHAAGGEMSATGTNHLAACCPA